MKLRKCLIALAIIAVFLYAGIQTTVTLQGRISAERFAMRIDLAALDGINATTNGDGGGDPVPGPGIPK